MTTGETMGTAQRGDAGRGGDAARSEGVARGGEAVDGAGGGARALVTGGAGFIGSHLVELLLRDGWQVTVVDDLSTGRRENLTTSAASGGIRFHEMRVSHAVGPEGPLRGERFDAIFHLAASVGVKLVVDDPVSCIENNVHETSALVRFAIGAGRGAHAGCGAPTLIASTSEVYGKAEKVPFHENDDVTYGPTTVFRWAYAQSKALDEYLGLATFQHKHLPVVVARFFNTVGPRQVGDYGMVLPRFVEAALTGSTLRVYGDGTQTRCFCDVRDVVRALPRLVENPACWGRVFNVGSDGVISIVGLARLVIEVLGSRSQVEFVPYHRAFASGFEDLRQRRPDITRVREAVGFCPTIPLSQTIQDVAAALRGEA